jgi:hypothetical protein
MMRVAEIKLASEREEIGNEEIDHEKHRKIHTNTP